MAGKLWLVLLLITLSCACALEGLIEMEAMKRRESFVNVGRSPGNLIHEVIFAVKQNNLDVIERMVIERATPGNPLYQQWLTFDEVGALIKNEPANNFIRNWLASTHDVSIEWASRRGEYIRASAPIATWEALFHTKFYEWEDQALSGNPHVHRCLTYFLSPEAVSHISAVFYTSQVLPVIRRHGRRLTNTEAAKHASLFASESNELTATRTPKNQLLRASLGKRNDEFQTAGQQVVTVSYLDSYYDIASNIADSSIGVSVFETDFEDFSQSDLNQFQKQYDLTIQSALTVNGQGQTTATCTFNTCGEGNLDIQYIMGISQKSPATYWYENPFNDPFVAWVTSLANDPNPQLSNSMSWGAIEQEIQVSELSSFNNEAMKATGIGVTIAISSGDNGVMNSGCACSSSSATSPNNCACDASSASSISSWTGSNTWTGNGYFPNFPATCPWVTAVGATQGAGASVVPSLNQGEQVCQSNLGGVITSGGGFSTYFAQPSWQTDAVANYFASLSSQPVSGFNSQGRGIPDISLLGVYYQVIIGGQPESVFGTSCSAPAFAGFISLLNSARASAGKGPIGFLNPSLYNSSTTNLFNDVTAGMNNYCANPIQACLSGFQAAVGWDPTTGWGSVDLPALGNITGFAVSGRPSSDSNSDNGLSTGAIAGIVIAVIFVIAVVATFVINRSCRSKAAAAGTVTTSAVTSPVLANAPQGQVRAVPLVGAVYSSSNPAYATNVQVVSRPPQL